MTVPAHRRSMPWIASAVVAVLLIWVACSGSEDPGSVPAAYTLGESTSSKPRVRTKTEHATAAVFATDVVSTASAEPETSKPVHDEFLPLDLFPRVRVEVAWPDGTPAVRARVYALPAGTLGMDATEADPVPTATTDESGTCELVVAAPGTFDVGALGEELGFALVQDVRVPEASTVRLVLPHRADVEFELGPELAKAAVVSVGVRYLDDGGPSSRATYPGRGQVPRGEENFGGDRATFPRRVALPSGVALFASANTGASSYGASFSAPARVTLGRQDFRFVIGRFSLAPSDVRWDRRAWIDVQIDWGPGARPRHRVVRWMNPPGEPLDPNTSTGAAIDAESGVVRWSGRGLEPGEAAWRRESGERTVDIPIVVRVAEQSAVPRSPRYRVVRSETLPAGGEVTSFTLDEHELGWSARRDIQRAFDDGENFVGPEDWVLAADGDEVAGPVRADPLDDRETLLELKTGGYLVVQRVRLPPPDVGSVTISRADGRPFLSQTEDGPDAMLRRSLSSGLVIGPLAPGRVEFTIRVGLREVGTVTGVVEAGRRTKLEIPDLAPRAR